MAAVLWVVQRWKATSPGYGWTVGACVPVLAFFAWGASGASAPLLLVSAVTSAGAVVVSMVLRKREDAGRTPQSVLEAISAIAALVAVAQIAAEDAGDVWLAVLRGLTGAVFLGAVTDAMVLGHWYLIDPKLPKSVIGRITKLAGAALIVDMGAMCLPPDSIISAFSSGDATAAIAWLVCAVFTGVLLVLTSRALEEPGYASVMAATGLFYVATMTAFGTVVASRLAVS